jgi:DNA-binding beta-propeller fold protein YncE
MARTTRRGRVPFAWRVGVVAITLATATGVAAPPAEAAWSPPSFSRMISAASRPGISAWGLVYNPVTDEFVVGDYVSNQIRRFSRTGRYLGDFTNPQDNTGSIVSAVAVDPRNGAVYAAATSLTTQDDIRKYDGAGNFLYGFDVPGRVAWLTVDDQGYLWYPPAYGSHQLYKFAVNDATRTASQVLVTGTRGTGPGQAQFNNGVDAAANGDVYVADGINRTVHVYDTAGRWRFDLGDTSVFAGDLRGVVVDDRAGRVYVADAKGSEVEAFDLAGRHLFTTGGEGSGPGQFGSGPRQLTVTPDGHIWAADYSFFRVHEYGPDGTWLSQFPWPAMHPDDRGLVEPWAVGTDPTTGDVLVADHFGQRIQRFSSGGGLLQVFGRRGRNPEDGLNYPRGVTVDPATGNVWVLNAEGAPYLVVYDRDFHVLRQIVTLDLSTGLELVGGKAFVVYRSRGIQVFDMATGALERTFAHVGSGTYQGLGVDPSTGRMWVPIRDQAQVRVLNPDGSLRWTLAAQDSPTDVAFRGDVVYVTDTGANVIIAYDRLTGARLGSFGCCGNGPGQLNGPKGIDVGPDGNLYVVEVRSSRVQVFTFDPPPALEADRPTLTVTPPATSRLPVVLSGTATDAAGIAMVEVSVFHENWGRYLNVRQGTWSQAQIFNQAVFAGERTNGVWSFAIIPAAYSDRYKVNVRVTDLSGNKRSEIVSFTVDDTLAPLPTVSSPAPNAAVGPLQLTSAGTVSDDGFVHRVEVGLSDPATGLWWDPTRGWGTETWAQASLAGGTSWSGTMDVAALAATGPYDFHVRAFDLRGNEGRAAPAPVTVAADTVEPDSTILVPVQDGQLPSPPTISGLAADTTSVAAVEVAVKDRDTSRWWNAATAAWGPLTWNRAALAAPGATSTGWTWTPTLGPGRYYVQTRALDGPGNVETSWPSARFTVTTGPVDQAPPETVISRPVQDQQLGAPPLITGTASDDLSVAAVKAALKNRDTGLWWNQATATWGPITWNPATLAAPGATTTGWAWSPSVGTGNYLVQARAVDGAGRTDPTIASARFSAVMSGTVPWIEGFDLPNGTRADSGPTAWALSYAGSGVAEVRTGDLYLQGMGTEAVWRSESINIAGLSGATVRISWRGDGTLDSPDTLRAFYRIDGGPEVLIAGRSDDVAVETVSVTGLTGSMLEIVVRSYSTGNDEAHVLQAVEVTSSA